MRVVFFGTPAFAATVLQELLCAQSAVGALEVVGVVTRPDAVRARGLRLVPSDVKVLGCRAELPVFEPTDLRAEEFLSELRALAPDVICVASYGKIMPTDVLNLPRFGCLNVHASLLPRWRGAAPIERAILAGDIYAGASIMRVEELLDSGDYCRQATVEIGEKSSDELRDELAHVGGVLLGEVVSDLARGQVTWTAQDEAAVTYAQKIERGELNVQPRDDATHFVRKVRASSRNHPSKMRLAGKPVIVEGAIVPANDEISSFSVLNAGEALFAHKRLFLGTDGGIVEVVRVRPEGKNSMDADAFMQGIQGAKGNILQWERYE